MCKEISFPRLIIVCGLPGSGKTTHAKSLEEKLGGIRFAPDEWLVALGLSLWDEQARAKIECLQWAQSQRLLALGLTVIIEWGTWSRSERDELRNGARKLGALVELHYLDQPMEVLMKRIKSRGMEKPPIQREQLLEWSQIFQAPTAEEFALFDEPTA
jgi:predicted kinase